MLKEQVKVKVVPCEIYSRVVGYFRPVQNWNAGKQQEFSERKTLKVDSLRGFARRTCGC